MTEEDKKNPKDAARWKAPDTSSDDQGDFWQEQEPVQFLQVPPLADDDKTPVVGLVRKSPPKAEAKPQTVQNLDLNAIQAGLAQLEDEKRSKEAEAIKSSCLSYPPLALVIVFGIKTKFFETITHGSQGNSEQTSRILFNMPSLLQSL